MNWYAARNEIKDPQGKNNHLLFILNKIVQFIVYLTALFVILWILGIDLSTLVVSLGVGGIAIAFALQSTLSDVFSAFSIYFDRPFQNMIDQRDMQYLTFVIMLSKIRIHWIENFIIVRK